MSKQSLAGIGFKSEELEIGGETYEIREMDTKQLTEYQSALVKGGANVADFNFEDSIRLMILYCLFQNGVPVYEKRDLGLIVALPSSVSKKITDVAQKINGLDGEPEKN